MKFCFYMVFFVLIFNSCNNTRVENVIYTVVGVTEKEFPYTEGDTTLTQKIVIGSGDGVNNFKNGEYKNKNIGNVNISDLFEDWEILIIIKRIEGYYDGSSRIAVSHNNPCNLKYGSVSKRHGGVKGKQETYYGEGDYYAYFKTVEDGNNACLELIPRIRKRNPTVRAFFTRWSSYSGGITYTKFVDMIVNMSNYPLDYKNI